MFSLHAKSRKLTGDIPLPASKSESNRALIIQALNPAIELHNLASARDTQTMIRLLASEGQVLDVIDAGTTMRFLTAYCAVTGRDQILTGTPRMCKRPIGALVDALRQLGANIDYWKQEGYPPLHVINGRGRMRGGELAMPGNVSSQFISAILLIAPYLEGGLTLTLTESVTSRPYLDMTIGLMDHFGVPITWVNDHQIWVPEQPYEAHSYTIESDWSGASYWYALAALSEEAELLIRGLRKHSLQGDRRIASMMEPLGVTSEFTDDGVIIRKAKDTELPRELSYDCLETPDLAQTLAVVAGALGVRLTLTGLHTLRVKETDRIAALENELGKFGLDVASEGDTMGVQGSFQRSDETILTYEDHRMAMAFAPLALVQPELRLDDPEVVVKSYPEFWEHLNLIGIEAL